MTENSRMRQPFKQGTIVLVEMEFSDHLGKSYRPCIVVRSLRLHIQGRPRYVYPVVPLSNAELPFGDISPRLPAREGGLPAKSTALCAFVQTVPSSRITGCVGMLSESEYEQVAEGLAAALGLRT